MHLLGKLVERFTCHPELLLIVAAYFVALTFLANLWWGRFNRVYKCHWYDLSRNGPNEDMCFRDIKRIMDCDPLDLQKRRQYRFPLKYVALDIMVAFVAVLVTYSIILTVCSYPQIDLENKLGLIFPSGLLALVGAIVGASYQVRLRARSLNRQEWINSIRKEIGILIDSYPPPTESRRSIEATTIEMKQHLVNLNLYLNPSERVHRVFLEVLRFMYGFPVSDMISDKECECQNTQKKLCIPESRFIWETMEVSRAEVEWNNWHLRAVRLANVLLKREWEQVKHVK